jgi:hypothetical protein
MELKQNPFTLYDFLGYFVPGALFIFSILIGLSIIGQSIDPIKTFGFDTAEFYLLFILASYLFGHLLSFLSSITVERYSIWRVGYPSKYLLGAAYPKYFDVKDPKTARYIVRTITAIFLFPISIFDILFGQLLRLNELFAKPLDDMLMGVIISKATAFLISHAEINKQDINPKEVDYFRIIYHYCLEKAPAHNTKMQNYVALYGFSRTITFASIILFWISIIPIFTGIISILIGVLLWVIAFISYLEFTKFYRRFSLEVLMSLVSIYEKE